MNPLRTGIRKSRRWWRALHERRMLAAQPAVDPTKRDGWSIALYAGDDPLRLVPHPGVTNPILVPGDVGDMDCDLVADPFLHRSADAWHLFFEAVDAATQTGRIAVASSTDGREWRYERVVLTEPFHLSYPSIVESGGVPYLIPESHQARAVRCYRPVSYPFEWEHAGNLIEGEWVDPTVFQHEGRWWMFAGSGHRLRWHAENVHLFHADELHGPWTEHPKSPILRGNRHRSRPAGRIRSRDGRLFRLAQDCAPFYGTRVLAFEITELTPTRYRERQVAGDALAGPSGSGWNAAGMHHIDAHPLDGRGWIASVDGWRWIERRPL